MLGEADTTAWVGVERAAGGRNGGAVAVTGPLSACSTMCAVTTIPQVRDRLILTVGTNGFMPFQTLQKYAGIAVNSSANQETPPKSIARRKRFATK